MYSRRQKQEKYYTAAAGAHKYVNTYNTDSAVFTKFYKCISCAAGDHNKRA